MRWSALGLRSHWLSATSTVTLWAAVTRKMQQSGVMFLPWAFAIEWVTLSNTLNKITFYLHRTARHICPSLSSAPVRWWAKPVWGPSGGPGREEWLSSVGHSVQRQLGDHGGHGSVQTAGPGLCQSCFPGMFPFMLIAIKIFFNICLSFIHKCIQDMVLSLGPVPTHLLCISRCKIPLCIINIGSSWHCMYTFYNTSYVLVHFYLLTWRKWVLPSYHS